MTPSPPVPVTEWQKVEKTACPDCARVALGTNYAILSQLHAGDVCTPVDVGGTNAWVEVAPGQWACVQLNASRYMEPN